jgi:hypothetical protein
MTNDLWRWSNFRIKISRSSSSSKKPSWKAKKGVTKWWKNLSNKSKKCFPRPSPRLRAKIFTINNKNLPWKPNKSSYLTSKLSFKKKKPSFKTKINALTFSKTLNSSRNPQPLDQPANLNLKPRKQSSNSKPTSTLDSRIRTIREKLQSLIIGWTKTILTIKIWLVIPNFSC